MTKLLDIALADGRFYTLIDALRAADLTDILASSAPFTLLAPTDDAFNMLFPTGSSALMQDVALMQRILRHHVLPGKYLAAHLLLHAPVATLAGAELNVRLDGQTLYVQDAQIMLRDMEGDDGVMHALDKVLLPPTV
ncbi:MAG: fasciclin domain-containing protein [Chloroflexota bacterium]|nr:fasciclin domain-containing protein [Chloroflexota bacterium]